ncbi:hypothetical protein TKWG_10635 [Advenella kashmirensis WT001]|uniref:Uncharacterized protein n=1 Tax=Advenella kashmirensis (strain DSM 17095 / LMG 22695 / WT001) TaxID=1036672 RepID=I3UBJ1_ADVKW|nr:hypothetical protein TKWG_10635 [Advenella kashmirensis WT001]
MLFCFFLVSGFSPVHALDLNQATRAQLRAIKGVGDKLADRILTARQRGRFVSLEDLAAGLPGWGRKNCRYCANRAFGWAHLPGTLSGTRRSVPGHAAASLAVLILVSSRRSEINWLLVANQQMIRSVPAST